MSKKIKKPKVFDIKLVNFNPTLKFDKLTAFDQMPLLDWYEKYFLEGIYYDPKRDAKERWELSDILLLWESGVSYFNSSPVYHFDVEKCEEYCEDKRDWEGIEYFKDIRENGTSIQMDDYLVNIYQGKQLPLINSPKFGSFDGKNNSLVYGAACTFYPEYVKDFKINVGICAPSNRFVISKAYGNLAGGVPPNHMSKRIQNETQIRDDVYNLRQDFYVELIPFGKTEKEEYDLMSLYISPTQDRKLDDLKTICRGLKWVTDGDFKTFDPSLDEFYTLNIGNMVKCKSLTKRIVNFTKNYIEVVEKPNLRTNGKFYLVMLLCEFMNNDKIEILKNHQWKSVIDRFNNFLVRRFEESNSESQNYIGDFYTDGQKTMDWKDVMSEFFSDSEGDKREAIINDFLNNFYKPLIDDKVINIHVKDLYTQTQRFDKWVETGGKVRIQGKTKQKGEFRDSYKKKSKKRNDFISKYEKEWDVRLSQGTTHVKVDLITALSTKISADHILPRKGHSNPSKVHDLSNMELTTKEYNSWKQDDEPDYN